MRLIDAEAFDADIIKRYCKHCDNGKGLRCRVCWINDMLSEIEEAPTIEAKPIVHAHWIYDGEDDWSGNSSWYCSKCSSFIETEEDTLSYGYNFCPNCGAQMDELVSNTNKLKCSEKPNSCGVKIPVISMEDVPKIAKD